MALPSTDRPLISVVVPAHNEERFLDHALTSLAGQGFRDIEIIVVDNGSTDGAPNILAAWARREPRLRTVRLDRPSLHESLRRGFALARADLIARLDADDVAEPERLDRQFSVMSANSGLGLLGSAATLIDARGRAIGRSVPGLDDAAIRRLLPNECPFIHSSVIMRRQAYEAAGGYRPRLQSGGRFRPVAADVAGDAHGQFARPADPLPHSPGQRLGPQAAAAGARLAVRLGGAFELPRLSGVSRWQAGQQEPCGDAPLRQTVPQ